MAVVPCFCSYLPALSCPRQIAIQNSSAVLGCLCLDLNVHRPGGQLRQKSKAILPLGVGVNSLVGGKVRCARRWVSWNAPGSETALERRQPLLYFLLNSFICSLLFLALSCVALAPPRSYRWSGKQVWPCATLMEQMPFRPHAVLSQQCRLGLWYNCSLFYSARAGRL